ncbi:MAG TPA: hypothetical protein VF518_04500 [Polyangia bacterium]
MTFDGPRLRRDLISTVLQIDGARHVDVCDPKRGSTFRLFDYEYSVALAFDGRSLSKVIPWVRLSTGLELTEEQLTSFAQRLAQLGFLDVASAESAASGETPLLEESPASDGLHFDTPSPVTPVPELASPPTPSPGPIEAAGPSIPFASETPSSEAPTPCLLPSLAPPRAAAVAIEPSAAPPITPIPLPQLVLHPRRRALAPPASPPPPIPRSLTPGPRRTAPVPPVPTPPPYVTPSPVVPSRVRLGPWILYALFGILAALAVGVLAVPLALKPRPSPPAQVQVIIAKATDVLRWFDVSAPVEPLPSQELNFPVGGKVIRLTSPGISMRPGDVLAATDAARGALADLSRQQERLAFVEQTADGARDMGNEKRANAEQAKLEASTGQVEKMQAALAPVAVLAESLGQVEATLAKMGQTVQAGVPAVRFKPAGWRVRFELPRVEAARVRKQGLCQVEIAGKLAACSLAAEGGDETHVVIELGQEAATMAGQSTRLARARFTGVLVVPVSALSHVGNSDRVFVVASMGRAEERSVAVVDRTAVDAVITQGLDAGDALIVETSQPIGAGARVRITQARTE